MPSPPSGRRSVRSVSALVALAALGAVPAAEASAQSAERARPFSTIALTVGAASNVNRERLHEYWRAGTGIDAELSTPFHAGTVGIGVLAARFRARADAQPDFDARAVTVRWSVARPLAGPLAAEAGALFGSLGMRFDDDRPTEGLTTEQELIVGGRASLHLLAGTRLAAAVTATWQRVLTAVPIDLATVGVGVRYAAPTPRWVRAVLE
jgi:hypothetical protein